MHGVQEGADDVCAGRGYGSATDEGGGGGGRRGGYDSRRVEGDTWTIIHHLAIIASIAYMCVLSTCARTLGCDGVP